MLANNTLARSDSGNRKELTRNKHITCLLCSGALSEETRVAKSLVIFSRTFSCFVIIEILIHACCEHRLDIAVFHIFSNQHSCVTMGRLL